MGVGTDDSLKFDQRKKDGLDSNGLLDLIKQREKR